MVSIIISEENWKTFGSKHLIDSNGNVTVEIIENLDNCVLARKENGDIFLILRSLIEKELEYIIQVEEPVYLGGEFSARKIEIGKIYRVKSYLFSGKIVVKQIYSSTVLCCETSRLHEDGSEHWFPVLKTAIQEEVVSKCYICKSKNVTNIYGNKWICSDCNDLMSDETRKKLKELIEEYEEQDKQ